MNFAKRCGSCLLLSVVLLAVPCAVRGQAPAAMDANMVFDVRNGDQTGKLMLKDNELAFESLSDARHSHNWKYADIRELSRKRKEVRIQPFRGDRYDFQFKNNAERDRIYDLISQRVLAARQGPK